MGFWFKTPSGASEVMGADFNMGIGNCMKALHPITARYSRLEMDITCVRAWLSHQIRWSYVISFGIEKTFVNSRNL